MYRNQISTNRAGPSATLIPDELPDADFLNLYKILHHAHATWCNLRYFDSCFHMLADNSGVRYSDLFGLIKNKPELDY